MSTLYVDNLQPNLGSRVMAAGHVVQVVSKETSAAISLAQSNSHSNVITHVITPTSSSSKVRVHVCGIYYINNNSSSISHHFRIQRDGSTPTHNWSQGAPATGHYLQYRTSSINNHIPVPFNFTIFDSPASTSAVSYSFDVRPDAGSLYFYSGFSMYLEEIAQ